MHERTMFKSQLAQANKAKEVVQRRLDRTENNWKSAVDRIVSDYKILIKQLEDQIPSN